MVPASQIGAIVAQALATFAASQQPTATEQPKFTSTSQQTPELPVVSKESVVPQKPVTELYGNLDKNKRFNLKKLLPAINTLPTDKYIIIKQKHNVLSDGSVAEDETARLAQPIEPGDYLQYSVPDKSKILAYDLVHGTPGTGGGWTLVHQPEAV